MQGPTLPISQEILDMKYLQKGESFREGMSRVAHALSGGDNELFHAFRDLLLPQKFLPAGRVMAGAGAAKIVTLYNCFVSGTIEDSMGDIMSKAAEAAQTMRMGGGIGYDFSTLRPEGDNISTLDAPTSGPVSFMRVFDAVCSTISSAGNRRGAQMGVLRVDHPDIEAFIHAKQNSSALTNFNISIGATDEFMRCVVKDEPFTLKWGGRDYKQVNAKNLFETIMRSTWDWAEPGVLFIDRINEYNNLWQQEYIAATNPCAEQPLPPYGACLLGSFNMTKYIKEDKTYSSCEIEPMPAHYYFDFDEFKADIPIVVEAMDNSIDIATYPLEEQEYEAKSKRRMGLGVTGMANALEVLGHAYGSSGYLKRQGDILAMLRDECYRASALLAKRKGSFPLYQEEEWRGSATYQALPPDVQRLTTEYGLRNSHLTSIAPTGTISLAAGNISSGIEPVFSYEYERTIKTSFTEERKDRVTDYAWREWGVKGKHAGDCTVQDHLAVLLNAQKFIDSAVSKTCNVGDDVSYDEFKNVYLDAWRGGAKGITTFRAAGKRHGVLNAVEETEEGSACYIDPETGTRSCE